MHVRYIFLVPIEIADWPSVPTPALQQRLDAMNTVPEWVGGRRHQRDLQLLVLNIELQCRVKSRSEILGLCEQKRRGDFDVQRHRSAD